MRKRVAQDEGGKKSKRTDYLGLCELGKKLVFILTVV